MSAAFPLTLLPEAHEGFPIFVSDLEPWSDFCDSHAQPLLRLQDIHSPIAGAQSAECLLFNCFGEVVFCACEAIMHPSFPAKKSKTLLQRKKQRGSGFELGWDSNPQPAEPPENGPRRASRLLQEK